MDEFDIVAKFKTVQGINQSNQNLNRLQKEFAETKRALNRLEESNKRERERENKKPQCPWCGGRFEKGYTRCKHCSEEITWVGNFYGKPEEHETLTLKNKKALENKEKEEEDRRALRQQEAAIREKKREAQKKKQARRQENIAALKHEDPYLENQERVIQHMHRKLVLENKKIIGYYAELRQTQAKPLIFPPIALFLSILWCYMFSTVADGDGAADAIFTLFGWMPVIPSLCYLFAGWFKFYNESRDGISHADFKEARGNRISEYVKTGDSSYFSSSSGTSGGYPANNLGPVITKSELEKAFDHAFSECMKKNR